MDLKITNYGTDGREYTLTSTLSSAREYSAVFQCLSMFIYLLVCMVVYVICTPIIEPYVKKSNWNHFPSHEQQEFAKWTLIPCTIVLFLIEKSFGSTIIEESVLVIPQIGVQLRKKQRNGHERFMFIEAKCIKAVLINEAITFSDVIYYLAFLVQDETKLILAFETFRPRIIALQKIYTGTKHLLFPDDTSMSMF